MTKSKSVNNHTIAGMNNEVALLLIVIVAIIVIIALNIMFPNRVLQLLITNLNNIIILGILSLLIYILIFFLDKDKEYKSLRKFIEERKVKLDDLIENVNSPVNKHVLIKVFLKNGMAKV